MTAPTCAGSTRLSGKFLLSTLSWKEDKRSEKWTQQTKGLRFPTPSPGNLPLHSRPLTNKESEGRGQWGPGCKHPTPPGTESLGHGRNLPSPATTATLIADQAAATVAGPAPRKRKMPSGLRTSLHRTLHRANALAPKEPLRGQGTVTPDWG